MAESPRDAADLGLDPPPRSKSRAGRWIALGCAAALGLAVLCAGGGFLFLRFGFEQVEANLLAELRENEILAEHVGEIRELEIDWPRSFEKSSADAFVYRVEGSAGSGWITITSQTMESGGKEIHSAELVLPSGERVDLFPSEPAAPSVAPRSAAPAGETVPFVEDP